ncbi:hypothetical protein HY967_02370 [Candidatus Jorgensenbacteria bacterium]|nr:hypothetical protein [Candidatus Jorgensenbacteria bacterium]
MGRMLIVVLVVITLLGGCEKKPLEGIVVSDVKIFAITDPVSSSYNLKGETKDFFVRELREKLTDAGLRFDEKSPLSIEGDVYGFSNGTAMDYVGEELTSRISLKDQNDLYETDGFGRSWPIKRKWYVEGYVPLGFRSDVNQEDCDRLAEEMVKSVIKTVQAKNNP